MTEPLHVHRFCFNPTENGGESLVLETSFFSNGDPAPAGIYFTQELTLNSYGNAACFKLCGSGLTPGDLRRLADELELIETNLKDKEK